MYFEVEEAVKYGVKEAILINNLRFWILKNKANEKHFYDGRYWTYNSCKAFAKLFPFWGEATIKRIIQSLKEQGVILTGNYNKSTYDRTNWYAFVDNRMLNDGEDENEQSIVENNPFHSTKSSNGEDENVPPIPYINTDNKNTDKNTINLEKKKTDPFIKSHLEVYFSNEYKKEFNSTPYMLINQRNKLLELNAEIENFKATIPEALKRLKNIRFKDIDFTPNYIWLLKDDNYIKVLSGVFDKPISESEQFFKEGMAKGVDEYGN